MRSIKYIAIDIGKRNCYVCVKGEEGNVLEETSYANLYGEALKYATEAKARYGQCKAVCESTGNLWTRTADAFEKAGIPLKLANPLKTKAIAWASIKNDTVDARTLAHLSRADLLAGVAEWLVARGHLTKSHCPVKSGPANSILSTHPVHQNGKRFRMKRKVGKLFVDVHGSQNDSIRHALTLIDVAGLKKSDFMVRFAA